MRIGKKMIDLESLTVEDLDQVIKEAKRLRIRKVDAKNFHRGIVSILTNAKEANMDICNKYTGEVLNADDWVVYDNELQCLHEGEWVH